MRYNRTNYAKKRQRPLISRQPKPPQPKPPLPPLHSKPARRLMPMQLLMIMQLLMSMQLLMIPPRLTLRSPNERRCSALRAVCYDNYQPSVTNVSTPLASVPMYRAYTVHSSLNSCVKL